MKVTTKTATIAIGATLELTSDEVGNLVIALGDYIRLMKEYRNLHGGTQWSWIEVLKEELDKVR